MHSCGEEIKINAQNKGTVLVLQAMHLNFAHMSTFAQAYIHVRYIGVLVPGSLYISQHNSIDHNAAGGIIAIH